MSFDVELVHAETEAIAILPVSHDDGGTIVKGGSNEAYLNITYNYSQLFKIALHPEGLRHLNRKTARDVILPLSIAVEKLGIDTDPDYWKATPGNAGHALNILLRWARWFPDHVFIVT